MAEKSDMLAVLLNCDTEKLVQHKYKSFNDQAGLVAHFLLSMVKIRVNEGSVGLQR